MTKITLRAYNSWPAQELGNRLHGAAVDAEKLLQARQLGVVAVRYGSGDAFAQAHVARLESAPNSEVRRYAAIEPERVGRFGTVWELGAMQIWDQQRQAFGGRYNVMRFVMGWTGDGDVGPDALRRLTETYSNLAALALYGESSYGGGAWAAEPVDSPPEIHEALRRAGYSSVGTLTGALYRTGDRLTEMYYPSGTELVIYEHQRPDSSMIP